MKQNWDDQIERVAAYLYRDERDWKEAKRWGELKDDHKQTYLRRAQSVASMFNFPNHSNILAALDHLCPCDRNPETTGGPERECPIDGEQPWAAHALGIERRIAKAAADYVKSPSEPLLQRLTELVKVREDHESA